MTPAEHGKSFRIKGIGLSSCRFGKKSNHLITEICEFGKTF